MSGHFMIYDFCQAVSPTQQSFYNLMVNSLFHCPQWEFSSVILSSPLFMKIIITEKTELKSLTFLQIFCLHTYKFIHYGTQSFFVFSSLRKDYNFLCSKRIFPISSNLMVITLTVVNIIFCVLTVCQV